MKTPEAPKTGTLSYARNNLHAARPLLQAVALGMLLAACLMAAAALARPEGTSQLTSQPEAVERAPALQGY